MKNIQRKKGMSIGDMYPAVLTLVLVGIVLGVGLFVLSTFHTQLSPNVSGSQNLINCSTATTLTDAALTQFDLRTVDTATNQTGTATSNYTFSSAGIITWGSAANSGCTNDGNLMNVTYTYKYDAADSTQEATTTVIAGLATFADWIAIIVVVIAAAIVLGIVIMSFGRKRNMI